MYLRRGSPGRTSSSGNVRLSLQNRTENCLRNTKVEESFPPCGVAGSRVSPPRPLGSGMGSVLFRSGRGSPARINALPIFNACKKEYCNSKETVVFENLNLCSLLLVNYSIVNSSIVKWNQHICYLYLLRHEVESASRTPSSLLTN